MLRTALPDERLRVLMASAPALTSHAAGSMRSELALLGNARHQKSLFWFLRSPRHLARAALRAFFRLALDFAGELTLPPLIPRQERHGIGRL